jgi:uncharacterized protein (DUF4213/DUF364 family)
MSIVPKYLNLAETIAAQIVLPKVSRLYLPELNETPDVRDEFGLLFLEGGIVAPFYASLPGTLDDLWHKFPVDINTSLDLLDLISLFADRDAANKAIALGAFNAMSQFVMKRAGLLPLPEESNANMGTGKARTGERIGMVGYFCPLIDKLLARGVEVLVLERQPERVEIRPGVFLSQDPADLEPCRIVLCTAATLINDSIEDILAHCQHAENFSLIGPSGSGLPDVLFDRGVDSVGGVYFPNDVQLSTRLRNRDSWGSAGQKYQLTPNNYPGYQTLLSRLQATLSA